MQVENAEAQKKELLKRPLTKAEKNARTLRRHLGERVRVTKADETWGPIDAEIVGILDDVLTLFLPAGVLSGNAYAVRASCDEIQLFEDSEVLHLTILRRYGATIPLGTITKWEDRDSQPVKHPRGENLFHANYRVPQSSEIRGLHIHAPAQDDYVFSLVKRINGNETEVLYGDNLEISKKFAVLNVDYLAEGCTVINSGNSPVGPKPIFTCIR